MDTCRNFLTTSEISSWKAQFSKVGVGIGLTSTSPSFCSPSLYMAQRFLAKPRVNGDTIAVLDPISTPGQQLNSPIKHLRLPFPDTIQKHPIQKHPIQEPQHLKVRRVHHVQPLKNSLGGVSANIHHIKPQPQMGDIWEMSREPVQDLEANDHLA
ncbi:hypothetical protein JAAARDRAFT_191626 [Jaapia argillacea MUCL 33604]|uniref:Uncharacterized protein n=1 Tax=Jaapia argillacea MUCL 33604 TaxID=933084 RepID=A0A067PZS4_9AGAM|nr:hypothetical protein JAAARDRAFT_191626 [Jaapia argillacea MUCL 33604]